MNFNEELTIKNNNIKLKAFINYCRNGNYKNKYTLIMVHGFRGSMDGGGSSINFANNLADLVNVVRFEFSNSEKLSNRVRELKLVVDFVKNNLNKKIIIFGRSLGGVASIIVASKDFDIKALSLWATPRDLKKVFSNVLGSENYKKLIHGESIKYRDQKGLINIGPELILDAYQYDLVEAFKKWDLRPILILHGVNDQVVNVSQAEKNYETINSKNKKLVLLKKCDHSFSGCDDEVLKASKEWLRNIIECFLVKKFIFKIN